MFACTLTTSYCALVRNCATAMLIELTVVDGTHDLYVEVLG